MILEGFADKLEESIVKGNTSVGDWSSEKGAEINVLAHLCRARLSMLTILLLAHTWIWWQDTSAYPSG